jgi:thiosulfate/3-mercaptopyruvate sulfurtransferase
MGPSVGRSLVMLLLAATSVPVFAETLRVTPEWLKAHLTQPDLVVVDARPFEDYEVAHIPKAVSLPDTLTYQQKSQGGLIVEPDVMQKVLRERGIDNKDVIVVYDGGQLVDASRVFWALEVYGLKHVRILDRGYDYWVMKDYPVSSQPPEIVPSEYVTTIDNRRIASKFSTQLATINPNQMVIDARSPPAYAGKASTAKRYGHIPSAINIPVTLNIREQEKLLALRSQDELQAVYATVPKDKRIVVYCEIGRVSSTTYLAMRELGYDVANYDASWREWGNDFSLPIEP